MFPKACTAIVASTLSAALLALPAAAAVEPYGYEVAGNSVTPGTSGAGPTLTPGLYRLDLPNDGSPRTISVARADFPNLVANVLTAESDEKSLVATGDHKLAVELVGPNDTTCDSADQSLSKDRPMNWLQATVGYDAGDDGRFSSWSDCKEAPSLTVRITHETSGRSGTTAAELLLTGEPRATGATGSAATSADTGVIKPPKTKAAQGGEAAPEVTGGAGFTQATTVTGGTYSTKLVVGGWTFYRVRLGWGQRIAAELRVPADGSNFAPPTGVSVQVALFSPQRIVITPSYSSDTSTETNIYANDSSQNVLNLFSAPVRWANRNPDNNVSGPIDSDALEWTSVSGWYYLGVQTQLASGSSDKPVDSVPQIPTDLAIQVSGEPGPGPTYAGDAQPAVGKMSVGKGTNQTTIPWVRLSLSALAVLLAAVAVLWAMRARRSE